MKKIDKKEDLYHSYHKKIMNNYIRSRLGNCLLGFLLISLIYVFYNDNISDIVSVILLIVGLFLLSLGLFDPNDYQLKKRNKDLDKLRFEYEQYLDREKTRENYSGGVLTMDWICDSRFQFD